MNKLPETIRLYNETCERIRRNPDTFLTRFEKETEGWFFDKKKQYTYFQAEVNRLLVMLDQLGMAKTLLFPTSQAEVFLSVSQEYTEQLDYKLPFPVVFVQFSEPMAVNVPYRGEYKPDQILFMVISQFELSENDVNEQHRQSMNTPFSLLKVSPRLKPGILNGITAIYSDMNILSFSWMADSHDEFVSGSLYGVDEYQHMLKRLAISIIGYINCENVYLEKQGEVDDAINRKREKKGKSRLEPYYICRIKGVQYDGHATGEGSKHSIRYDVRGHFRRMTNGKTIWVRPHQRGLQNELYIPKTYKVDK